MGVKRLSGCFVKERRKFGVCRLGDAAQLSIKGDDARLDACLGQLFVPAGPFLVEHTRPGDRQDAFALVWASQSLSQALGSAIAGLLPSVFASTLAIDSQQGDHASLCDRPDWPWALPTIPTLLSLKSVPD